MPVTSHILDDDTSLPVAGISVVITDSQGKNLTAPIKTDNNGAFELPDSQFADSAGKKLKIYGKDADGNSYETKVIEAANVSYNSIFVVPLPAGSSGAEDANNSAALVKRDMFLPAVLAGSAVLCFAMAIIIKN